MNLQKVDALIEGWRPELTRKLSSWLKVASVNAKAAGEGAPFGRAVREMLDLALSDAREMGFETRAFDGYAGDITLGRGERTMGILAHLDVVPAGEGWTLPPFGGEVEGGRIYGRGAVDDKGPAIAALYAMRAVREAGIPLRDGVRLILGCDEETGMTDMRHYASKAALPDYGFSPDAEYPLINIEKGGMQILLGALARPDEGAEIPVYEMEAGERINVVPGAASVIVGTARVSAAALDARLAAVCAAHEGFALRCADLGGGRARVEAAGKGAHASTPHLGLNAAGMLLIALKELGAGGTCAPSIAALSDLLGMAHDGARLGIAIADELSGALTCNLGLLRYDGAVLSAQLDIRYPLSAQEETMCGQIAMAVSGTGLFMRRTGGHVPLHVPAEHEVVQGLLAVYHELTGLPAAPIAIGGGTYSRTMPNTVAFGIHFPGSPDPCHMPDEFIDLDELMLSVRIMAHAIVRLAGA